jgi:ribosomal protein L2
VIQGHLDKAARKNCAGQLLKIGFDGYGLGGWLFNEDGTLNYILAPLGLKDGDKVISGAKSDIRIGNCLPIENIPVGTLIHNIELNPGQGGKLVRTAGGEAQLMAKDGNYAHIRLPSRRNEISFSKM